MRLTASFLALLLLPTVLLARDTKRYGIPLDLKTFPQATPQETLASVIKAIDSKRIDYLVAQLANPTFVDERVKRLYDGNFSEQLADTTARLDPGTVKLLNRLVKEGEWRTAEDLALLSTRSIANRSVYMKKIGDRWFLENKQSP